MDHAVFPFLENKLPLTAPNFFKGKSTLMSNWVENELKQVSESVSKSD